MENDSLQLIQIEEFRAGKRFKTEDVDLSTGQPRRMVSYLYPTENTLEVEMKHFPASDNYHHSPSQNYSYLWKYSTDGKVIDLRYKKDTNKIVFVKLIYHWQDNNDIVFAGYNMEGKKIDSFLMTKKTPSRAKKGRNIHPKNDTILYPDGSVEDIILRDTSGNMYYWKECTSKTQCREHRFYYDNRGLLLRRECYQFGKLDHSLVYKYE